MTARSACFLIGVLSFFLFVPPVAMAQPVQSRITLLTGDAALGGGGRILLGIQIEPQAGWKTYWRTAGESGLPPTFEFRTYQNTNKPQILWPAPSRLSLQGQESYGYNGAVIFPFWAQPLDASKPLVLEIQADYAVCKDICVPEEALLTLTLPPGSSHAQADLARLQAALAKVPSLQNDTSPLRIKTVQLLPYPQGAVLRATIEADSALENPDLFAEGAPDLLFSPPLIIYAQDRRAATLDIVVQQLDTGSPVLGGIITLTLVDGDISIEKQVTVAQTPGTR